MLKVEVMLITQVPKSTRKIILMMFKAVQIHLYLSIMTKVLTKEITMRPKTKALEMQQRCTGEKIVERLVINIVKKHFAGIFYLI